MGFDLASLLPAWVLETLLVFVELWLRWAPLGENTLAVVLGVLGIGCAGARFGWRSISSLR